MSWSIPPADAVHPTGGGIESKLRGGLGQREQGISVRRPPCRLRGLGNHKRDALEIEVLGATSWPLPDTWRIISPMSNVQSGCLGSTYRHRDYYVRIVNYVGGGSAASRPATPSPHLRSSSDRLAPGVVGTGRARMDTRTPGMGPIVQEEDAAKLTISLLGVTPSSRRR